MFISDEAHAVLSRGEVRSGDLLVTITGNVGRPILLGADFGIGNINQHIARIRITDPNVTPAYVLYYLSQPEVRRAFEAITTGQAYPQLSLRQVRDALIPLPPLIEQRAIASSLSNVDALIAALDALIAKKRAVKTAAMQQLLTGRQRLPGFSGEWKAVSVASIATKTTGYWGSTSKTARATKLAQVVRAGDITTDGRLAGTATRYVSEDEFSRARCRPNDVVMTVSGTLGNVWLCDGRPDTMASNFVRILRCGPAAHGPYLASVLGSDTALAQIVEHTGVGAISNLRGTFFTSPWVPLPPVDEQKAIAAIFSDMDAEIAALEARRDKTRHIKTGMMQELLTGRTRLIPQPAE